MANPIPPGRKTPTLGPGQVLRDKFKMESWTYTAAGFKIPLRLPIHIGQTPVQSWWYQTLKRIRPR